MHTKFSDDATIFPYDIVIHSSLLIMFTIMYIMFCAKKTLLCTKLQDLAKEQYLKGALGA